MSKNLNNINRKNFEQKKKKIKDIGVNHLHVIADFDRTLTKAFVKGQKSSTVFAQLREGKYLTPEYSVRAYALFEKYYPIEISPEITNEMKKAKMYEWWKAHLNLFIESGMNKQIIEDVIKTNKIEFRDLARMI